MLLNSLHMKNILSFRDTRVEMKPLNVLIGANASGKSNLIETVALMQSLPNDLAGFFRRNGPVRDWIWKGDAVDGQVSRIAEITAVLDNPEGRHESEKQLKYNLRLTENNERLQVVGEKLENILPHQSWQTEPYYYFSVENGHGRISSRRSYNLEGSDSRGDEPPTRLTPDNFAPTRSVLSERRDPDNFPALTRTARRFASMRLYRNWNIGRDSPVRRPQPTDGDIEFLEEDFSNLALVVNELQIGGLEGLIDKLLNRFYEEYVNLRPRVYGGAIQLAANEAGMSSVIPATRLSDGTIRFIALLTVLCHPNPPELICIEEPETALHPGALSLLADLLRSASERSQVIVTTHSPELIDQFTDEPDAVVVCERGFDGDTGLSRLPQEELGEWLKDYRLAELWKKGVLGGNRW